MDLVGIAVVAAACERLPLVHGPLHREPQLGHLREATRGRARRKDTVSIRNRAQAT